MWDAIEEGKSAGRVQREALPEDVRPFTMIQK